MFHKKKRLEEVIYPSCSSRLSWFTTLFILMVTGCWILQAARLVFDLAKLLEMQQFYRDVFKITDWQLQTMHWHEVCEKIIETRDTQSEISSANTLPKLDPHIIANRILRKENFLIAMLNKNILNLNLPGIGYGPIFTRLMEWNINYCILSWVFDERGLFRRRFLKESNRRRLAAQY